MFNYKVYFSAFALTALALFSTSHALAKTETKNETVTILYFSDAHVIYPVIDHHGERGGVARLKTTVDNIKKDNRNVVLLFGGDLAGGVLFGSVFHGFPMVEALNKIPVDIANFGQHDFDFGSKITKELVSKSKFPWITSNLKIDGKAFDELNEYVIKQIGNIKIGFFGLTDDMDTTGGAPEIIQEDLFKATKQAIKKLKAKKVDYIVAITQTGKDTGLNLVKKFPDLNAVFTEEASENVSYASFYHNRVVLTACGNIGSVVSLNISKESDGSFFSSVKVYPVDNKIKSNPALKKLEDKYRSELNKKLDKKIANLTTPLNSGFTSDNASRFMETNTGDLITDAYRNYYQCNIALMNGGGIRADIFKTGHFTLKDAMSLLPFDNLIGVYKCSGKVIKEALEHGVSGVEKLKGSFLQVSGLSYTYSRKKPIGNRVSDIKVNGKSIDLNKEYTVAIPTYMFNGGDDFKMFKGCKPALSPNNQWKKDVDLLVAYCKKLGTINYSTENRITVN